MRLFLITVLVFLWMGSVAQQKAIFSSQNYVGLLTGEHDSKIQLQTIDGIAYRTWFIGFGTGIDWYYFQSIPAFISLNKDLLKKRNRNFCLALNGGVNFPWRKDNHRDEFGYDVEKLLTGAYWEGGAGYKIGFGKKNDALLIQVAYSYKHLKAKVHPGNIIIFDAPEPTSAEYFNYHLRRLSLKIGWNF